MPTGRVSGELADVARVMVAKWAASRAAVRDSAVEGTGALPDDDEP